MVQKISEDSIPLNKLFLSKYQPRRYFDQKAMQMLVASIKENDILQPLLVRPVGDRYEIVAGERRFRAALALNLNAVPATVREMTNAEALHFSLVENLQRQDLNPIEETEGILELLVFRLECNSADLVSQLYRLENEAKGKITRSATGTLDLKKVEQVFAELGRMNWRSFVRNRLPLLKLPPEILEALRKGKIEWTKAKEIAKLESEPERVALLEEAIAKSLTLRQLQKLVSEKKAPIKIGELQAEMEGTFKKAKKFAAWDNAEKCDKLKSLLAELRLLLE